MADKITCEVCGMELDRRGLPMHMAKHERESANLNKTEQKTEVKDMTPEETLDLIKAEKVKEVKLEPEKDVIEKKEVKKEEFNSCPDCGQTFKGFPNYCPKCGCEFE